MKKNNKKENIAFVDGQNVYMSTRAASPTWKIDLARFRIYLEQKYEVSRAYYFLGFLRDENQDLYNEIQEAGGLFN